MMHCAGYTHPERKSSDKPFDKGKYYNSPPLRSEICIAGGQSLTSFNKHRNCTINNGKAIIEK